MFRVALAASASSGLRKDFEVMIDKIVTSKRTKVRRRIGRLSGAQMATVDAALRLWMQLPEAAA